MALPANLRNLTARELKTALIIARRHDARGEIGRILAEYNRRGITPTPPKKEAGREVAMLGEQTYEQRERIDALAIKYDSVRVRELRKGPAILLTCFNEAADASKDAHRNAHREIDESQMQRMHQEAIGPDGEVGCEGCGSTAHVASRGVYGQLCEMCDDQRRDTL